MQRGSFAPLGIAALALVIAASRGGAQDYVEHHMLFRSMATGDAASAEQMASCEAHFADRRKVATGSNLDYRVWGIEIDASSGLVTNHNARDLGPGFLCSALPAPDGVAAAQSWAYMSFPGLPEFEVEGPCNPTATINTGETFWHCKLTVLPDAASGIYGGFLSTNSVLVLGSQDTQWPTGSVWTGYVVEAER